MKYPKILYKYTKNNHAMALLKLGVLRIGTLYDFRKTEYGSAITDVREATLYPSTPIIDELWGHETRPELRAFINVSKGASVNVHNVHFNSKIQSANFYLCCFSDKFCSSLYNDFDADTCIAINSPMEFLKIISDTIRCNSGIRLLQVAYKDKAATHRELQGYDPAGVKDLEFACQSEWRCLWQPIDSLPLPFVTGNYRITEFCRLHDVKK